MLLPGSGGGGDGNGGGGGGDGSGGGGCGPGGGGEGEGGGGIMDGGLRKYLARALYALELDRNVRFERSLLSNGGWARLAFLSSSPRWLRSAEVSECTGERTVPGFRWPMAWYRFVRNERPLMAGSALDSNTVRSFGVLRPMKTWTVPLICRMYSRMTASHTIATLLNRG